MITTANIETYRGALLLSRGDLPFTIWDVFDLQEYLKARCARILPLSEISSPKNELQDQAYLAGEKNDPRKTAFDRMRLAALEKGEKRKPITVRAELGRGYQVLDGNATVQALMLVGWEEVPAVIEE